MHSGQAAEQTDAADEAWSGWSLAADLCVGRTSVERMTHRRRLVIGLTAITGAVALAYVGLLVYVRYFWSPSLPIATEVTDVLASEAVAFVPEGDQPIAVVWLKEDRRETLADRGALGAWLCTNSRVRTSVLVGTATRTQGLLELQLVGLTSPPVALSCNSSAHFYAVRDRVSHASE